MTRSPRRPGFTLLEVLLAAVIAVLLMAGLYAALDITLTRTQANREAIDASDLSRAVVNRFTADLSAGLGPLPPKSGGSPAAGGSSVGGSSTTNSTETTTTLPASGSGTGTAAPPTTTTTTETTTTESTGETASAAATPGADIPPAAGLIGSETQLTMFVARLPAGLTDPEALLTPDVVRPAGPRRISYYLGSNGGLCRQERLWATADGVRNSADPDVSLAEADIIAPEVTAVSFEYFDGGTWQTSWDGSQTGSDGVSLIGPPRAVRITLTLTVPGRGGTTQKRVQHVVAVRAAVGTYVPPTDDTTTPTTTGGS